MIHWAALVFLLAAPSFEVVPVQATAIREGRLVLRTAAGERALADGSYRCGQCASKDGSPIEVRIENGTYGVVLGTKVKPGGVTVVAGKVVIRAGGATLTLPDGVYTDPQGAGFQVRGGGLIALHIGQAGAQRGEGPAKAE